MKKKFMSFLLALALVFTMAPMGLVAHAETYEGLLGRNVHYSINATSGVMTVSGSGPMEDYNQCPISSCSRYIKKIIVEPGVTRIGNSVFEELYDLVGVSLPDTVTEIGEYAFSSCYNLKSCPLPSKLRKIEDRAFNACSKLVGMTLPSTLKELGEGAFCYCKSISSINIPDGVKEIPSGAFADCYGLKKISIGKGVKKIAWQAFHHAGLTSLVIPANVTEIEHTTFALRAATIWSTLPLREKSKRFQTACARTARL
ncbi:MAG: leucine-rich repeat domain-containing protein [Acutalibacter sp.]|nr:leucine-rich repeat domain-containing protein [Acutalibacter sp.]